MALSPVKRATCPREFSCADDGALVQLYAKNNSEAAFTELVRRHGPMVLKVCGRALLNRQDAEDAFQLTFLVLAKKAPELRQPELVGNWLYGVALNVSRRARAAATRRRAAEAQMLRSSAATKSAERTGDSPHFQHLIDQEIERLPAKYRAAVVACYVQGRTNRDAARVLGWPLGTLVTRLNRAKSALRARVAARLKRETDTALTAALSRRVVPAAVPLALLASTLKATRKLHQITKVPTPAPRLRTPSSSAARVSVAKIQMAGVSAFSVALVVLGACLALGAIHHTTPAHANTTAPAEPDPPPPQHPTAPPPVNPAANAQAIAAALTQSNRNALADSTPRSRRQ